MRSRPPPTPPAFELWVIDVATAHAVRLGTLRLNAVLGRSPCEWMPDSSALLCKLVPAGPGSAPALSAGACTRQAAWR